MRYMKYIIVEKMGIQVPILFSDIVSHNSVAVSLPSVISAGFFCVDFVTEKVTVWGKSTSLDKESRKQDAEIIKSELQRWKQ